CDLPATSRQGRRRGQRLLDGRLGGLPPADPGGATLRRQGPDLPDRAGQQRRPPPSRALPPPLQGHLARPPHGRRRPQAALPPAATRELPAVARQLPICFRLSVSMLVLTSSRRSSVPTAAT